MDKWKILKKSRAVVQWISLFLFIFLLAYFPRFELFMRLNPFTGLSASIAGRSALIYFLPALFVLAATFLFGRIWCGWICPLGTVLDSAGFRKKKKPGRSRITWETSTPVKKHDRGLRKIKYLLLVIVLVCALFGNLSLIILDPVTIMTRTFTVSILPAVNHIVTEIERYLYNFDFLHGALDALDSLIRGTILPFNRSYFYQNIVVLLVFLGIILLNLGAHRFWCRYLCPLGGLLAFISRFSLFKRQVVPACTQCASCSHACPMDAIRADKQYKSEQEECTLCLDCFTQCPENSLAFSARREKDPVKGVRLSRKNFLVGIGAAALGTGFLKGDIGGIKPDVVLIRPPGVTDEVNFLSQCIRCGQCMKVCPTSGLQPCLLESGISGFWTPRLTPRAGPCDYTCHLCGQVCPTRAIPELTLSIKQQTRLGKAVVDTKRCLEWAEGADCLICREFCPLPVKAVERRERIEIDEQGKIKIVHGPFVIAERCIGCGICENLCPVEGDAAIRVMRKDI
ncbi:MAG: 4Fe-4S binding protein [Spirochaetales bacterium]|nr:4Fe-4S binding protein [Spirochaetales bacterium]